MTDIYRSEIAAGRTAAMPMASGAAFGAQVGEAAARLGDSMTRNELQEDRLRRARENEMAAVETGARLSEFGATWDGRAIEAKQNAAPGGAGYSQSLLEGFDKDAQLFLEGTTNEAARRQATARIAAMRGRLASDGAAFEAASRVAKTVNDLKVGQDADQRRLRLSGGNVALLGEVMDNFETTVAGLTLPADKKEAIVAEGMGWRQYSWAKSLDPAQRKVVLESGKLEHLTAPQLDALLSETEVDLRHQAREQATALAAAKSDAQEKINLAQKVVGDGGTLSTEEWTELQGLATKYELPLESYDLGKLKIESDTNRIYATATPRQIDARIKELDATIAKAGDHVKPEWTIERDRLATMLTQRTAELNHDPLGDAAKRGETLVEINWADPATLAARTAQARRVSARTGAVLKPLTDEEATELANLANGGPNNRLIAINRVAAFGPGGALAAARQVAGGDLVFERAVTLPAKYRALAVNGVDARKANSQLVTRGPAQEDYNRIIGGALRHLGNDFDAATIETAKNIYAATMARAGETEWNQERFLLAVHMALGGDLEGGKQRGGIGEHGGAKILLPTRMTQPEFDRRLGTLGGTLPAGAANGAPVWADGSPVYSGDIRKRFVPVAVRDGVYRFERNGTVLMTKGGEPWLLDIRKVGH